jgi:hypothetical protein
MRVVVIGGTAAAISQLRAAAANVGGTRLVSSAPGAPVGGRVDWALVPSAEERAAAVARLGLAPFRVMVVPGLADPAITEQQCRTLGTALARMRAIGRPRPHVSRVGVLLASRVSRFLFSRMEQFVQQPSVGRRRSANRLAGGIPMNESTAIALRRWQALRRVPTRKEMRIRAADRRHRHLERARAIFAATRRWNCPGA